MGSFSHGGVFEIVKTKQLNKGFHADFLVKSKCLEAPTSQIVSRACAPTSDFLYDRVNKLILEENNLHRILFKARKVAGSAKYKQTE